MKFLNILLLLVISVSFAQNELQTASGFIQFDATLQNTEEIIAKNNEVKATFDLQSGSFECSVLVKNFKFKLALMGEHFNNHYLQSDTYPKAYFKGKIIDFDASKITNLSTEFVLKGILTMHGKSKRINTKIIIKNDNLKYILQAEFEVLLDDFDIEIPKTLINQIASKSKIQTKLEFKK